ncbi:MAG: autotransporter outer membrane beta-barrel domain-containing protein [Thermoanaerobaculia bacterium]
MRHDEIQLENRRRRSLLIPALLGIAVLANVVGAQAQEPSSVEGVLDSICSSPPEEFVAFCAFFSGLEDSDRDEVVEQITPRENVTQGNLLINLPQTGYREVGRRLAALRTGVRAVAGRTVSWSPDRREVRIASTLPALFAAQEPTTGPGPGIDEPFEEAPRWGLFASGRHATVDKDGTLIEEGYYTRNVGGTVGLDRRFGDDAVLGAAVAYQSVDLDLSGDGGGIDADGFNVTAFASRTSDAGYLQGVLGYGTLDFDLTRHVDLPVPFLGETRYTVQGGADGDQLMADLMGGWEHVFGASTVELFGRASLVDANVDGDAEGGEVPFALAIGDQSIRSLLSELGIDWSRAVSVAWGVVQPQLRAGWIHEFDDDERQIPGQFVGDPLDREFGVPTDEPDRDYFNLAVGLTLTGYRGWSFFATYDTDLERSTLDNYVINLGLRKEM